MAEEFPQHDVTREPQVCCGPVTYQAGPLSNSSTGATLARLANRYNEGSSSRLARFGFDQDLAHPHPL